MPDAFVLETELPETHETILVPRDQSRKRLTELLRGAGIALNTRCGERGLCRGCEVELTSGRLTDLGRGTTVAAGEGQVLIRACQHRLADSSVVRLRVPARSLLGHAPQVVSHFTIKIPRAHNPLWQCINLRKDELSDSGDVGQSVCRALAERLHTPHSIQCPAEAPALLTRHADDADLDVAVEYDGQAWHVAGVADGSPGPRIGAAVDVGTTTVVLLLVDLDNEEILAEATDFNRQMEFGDDVVTRITLCAAEPDMVERLQAALARTTLGPLLESALQEVGRSFDDLACFTVAGNTTMLHLLAGVNPGPMGIAPFTPAFLEHRVITSAVFEAGMSREAATAAPTEHAAGGGASPHRFALRAAGRNRTAVHLLPGAAAYVGADVCAGVLASGLVYDDGPSILVDVGTNGEIVLKHRGHLLGCATAAGPAFEGCGLTCGVRAGDGAISHLRFTADPFTVQAEVIGAGTPVGICGSAYIDFLAQGRRHGLLNHRGRFAREALPRGAERLLARDDRGLSLRVAAGAGKRPVVISEADVARLLQAKAAIAAGILTLLVGFDLSPSDVKTLYLAGGFGLHVDPASAVACGLLPGFRPEQVEVLGNTSLAGAYLALLDSSALDELRHISRQIEIVELNLAPGFEQRYIRQLRL